MLPPIGHDAEQNRQENREAKEHYHALPWSERDVEVERRRGRDGHERKKQGHGRLLSSP